MISTEFIIWLIPSIMSIIIVYLVYRIYLFNKSKKFWLFVALGFLLIVILRVLMLLNSEGFFPEFFKYWDIYDVVLRLLNNICFILGFGTMLKNFENFDVVEKKVKKILKNTGGNKK